MPFILPLFQQSQSSFVREGIVSVFPYGLLAEPNNGVCQHLSLCEMES